MTRRSLALLMAATALLAGCSPLSFSYMYVNGSHPVQPAVGDTDHVKQFEYYGFTLRRDHDIHGHTARSGSYLSGVLRDGRWAIRPEYADLEVWTHRFAYGRRPGQRTMQFIDLRTGTTSETEFTAVRTARSTRTIEFTAGVPVAVVENDNYTPVKVALLGQDGRPVTVLERLRPLSFQQGPQPIDVLDDAYVGHHLGAGGEPVDIIYNRGGVPISPELPPLARYMGAGNSGKIVLAVPVGPGESLVWPLLANGTVAPKPEALLGLRALLDIEPGLRAWAVRWQTSRGPRWGVYPSPDIDIAGILATQQRASWEELEPVTTGPGVALVVRAEDSADYVVLTLPDLAPAAPQAFTSVASAQGFLRERQRQREEAAYQEARRRYDEYLAAEQRREAERKRRAAEAYERSVKNEAQARALIQRRKYAEAAALAAATDVQMLGRVVAQILSAAGGDQVATSHLTTARLYVSPDQGRQIDGLLAARQAEAYRAASAGASSYGSYGTAGSRPASVPAAGAGRTMPDIAAQTRWNSLINYLSGRQNWYFGSGYQVRR